MIKRRKEMFSADTGSETKVGVGWVVVGGQQAPPWGWAWLGRCPVG